MQERPLGGPEPVDVKAYAGQMAQALGLPLDDTGQVEANLAVAFRMASLVLDFPLDDHAEPAAVFKADPDAP